MTTATATIMCTDVGGPAEVQPDATAHAADPLAGAHEVVAGIVDRHGGRIVKSAGAEVLAAFESASAALDAARALLDAGTRGRRLRIGIAAGDVQWGGAGCLGHPVVTAARLRAAAEPGQTLASGVVRSLAGERGGAIFTPVGPLEPRGVAGAVEVYEVHWQRAATEVVAPPVPSAVSSGAGLPFVGRDEEWELLESAWLAALDGATRIVLLGGEAGAGKTRLATEFALRAHAGGAAVLYGYCDEQLGPPYQPWVQALSQLLRAVPLSDIDPVVVAGLAELAPMLPQLGGHPPSVAGVNVGDPASTRFRLFNAVATTLEAASERWPLIVVLDDLHWGSAESLALLSHVARSVTGWRGLVVGTFRDPAPPGSNESEPDDNPLAATLADLRRIAGVTRIRVGALDERAIAMLVGGHPHDTDPRLAQLIAAVADQSRVNAFFVGELWRHLIERGVVTPHGDGWIVASGVHDAGIPDSVREVVADRLARLDRGARHLAALGALAGQRVDLRVLRAAADMADADVAAAIDSLVAAGLLEPVDQGLASYRFRHAIVRETVETGISLGTRMRLHLRIAEALEQIHASDPHPVLADLARHFAASAVMGVPGKALYYLRRAAEQATQSYAYDDAATHLRAALELTETGSRERVKLLIELGRNETRGGRHSAAVETSGTAFTEALALGDAELVAESALCCEESIHIPGRPGEPALAAVTRAIELLGDDGSALRARLEGTMSRALALTGRAEEAALASDRAATMAREAGDDAALAWVLGARMVTFSAITHGTTTTVLETGEELQRLARHLGDDWLELYGSANSLRAAIAVGDMEHAARLLARHRDVARRSQSFVFEFMGMCYESVLALVSGRLDEAERLADEGQELGANLVTEYDAGVYGLQMFTIRREQGRLREVAPVLEAVAGGDGLDASVWRPGLAVLYAELGMVDKARSVFDAIFEQWDSVARDAIWPAILSFMGDTCLVVGDTSRAEELYRELLPFRGLNVVVAMTACLGPADRLLGGLAALMGRPDDAARHYETALDLAAKSGSPIWRERIIGDRERWLPDTGTEPGSDRCEEPPDGLSHREIEVLRLVAAGRSNREIGQALFISGNTVANHVRAILHKTESANRAEAAAYAARNGLLPD